MRVSSNQYHITVNASLQNSNAQLEKLMSQMASGNRLTRPSDDPITHVRIARLSREEASNDQYLSNISSLSTRLSRSEVVLTSMNNDLLNARDLLVWALDGSNTSNDLNAMASSLEAARDGILASSLNKDQEGNYMFSGTATRTPTVGLVDVLDASGNVVVDADGKPVQTYQALGNDHQQMVVVGNGLTQAANVAIGAETAEVLNVLTAALDAIRAPDVDVNDSVTRQLVSDALNGVDIAMDGISTKISQLGGAQNIIATLETNARNLGTANQTSILDYAQLDYGSAATTLNSLMSAIQATQSAYAKVSKLSLFNAL